MFECSCSFMNFDNCSKCKNSTSSILYMSKEGTWANDIFDKYMRVLESESIRLASYDPDRYELVEKKDWKIKDLEKRIEHTKKVVEDRNSELINVRELREKSFQHLLELEEELKELKKK